MILNVYKEPGWTSFDVVAKLRGILKAKVGHTGTLDPLAEGVLVVLTNSDTKNQDKMQQDTKEYICEMSFGATSPTYDLAQEVTYHEIRQGFDLEKELKQLLPKYTGVQHQRVPGYSAVKVDGKKLYEQARDGKLTENDLPKKEITIFSLELLSVYTKNNLPTAKLKIACSKGTYIRSLAHDLGTDLKVGAVVSSLVRTRVGDFTIETAKKISQLEQELKSNNLL